MSISERFFIKVLLAAIFVVPVVAQQDTSPSAEQSSDKSLADVAKDAKKNKAAHAKKVVTDEDVVPARGPLPPLLFEGDDNVETVLVAIADYKKNHSPEETEKVVRQWYDEYDEVLVAAIRTQMETSQRRSATVYNGYWGCQDSPNYQTCVARQRAEMRGSHDDQVGSSGFTGGRIQQAFMRMRNGLAAQGLNYKWFRIRNGNGVGYLY